MTADSQAERPDIRGDCGYAVNRRRNCARTGWLVRRNNPDLTPMYRCWQHDPDKDVDEGEAAYREHQYH